MQGKSFTEDELIGSYDAVPQALWTKYFLEAQGCTVEDKSMHQDNKSAIFLDTNGKVSSSKRTNHMKLRFFLIKYYIISCGGLYVY